MDSKHTILPLPFADRPLWEEGSVPDFRPTEKGERFLESEDHVSRITDVSSPSLTFLPATAVNGRPSPAVVICPGGGYGILAWNLEGVDIASWLNSRGISAFILKYRCPDRRDAALADATRAIRFVRYHADEFNVRADKIGILGFSAGAHLAARTSTLPKGKQPYKPVDSIDKVSARPDFQLILYPAYIERGYDAIDPDFSITAETPPAFVMQAEDDVLSKSSLAYYIALKEANVPAELHLFSRGGHGYGLLRNGNPTQAWPDLAYRWLQSDILN